LERFMIHVRREPQHNSVVLELCGSFDLRAAEQLTTIALQQPSGLHIVVDISNVDHVYDSALGRLVDSLPRTCSHTIRGTAKNRARVLGQSATDECENEEETHEMAHTD
jgi:anti-anti-sigma regulatory factor